MLTDIHAHPALNAFLFDRDLRKHYWSGSTFNPLSSLSDFKMLHNGGVKVLWSSLHVPERELESCIFLRIGGLFTAGGRYLMKHGPWDSLLRMMDTMEKQIARADQVALARTNAELDQIIASGRIAIVHTVEGAHVLEGRLERLELLAQRGVASITLTHLFPNNVAGHVEGLPSTFKFARLCGLKTGVELQRGLTQFGGELIDRMVELRMLPDLAHCTPRARSEVFQRVNRRVPVLATHVGVQSVNPEPYNLSAEEIREIHATGGVIGVIFMPYWLDPRHPKNGKDAIWKTLSAIHDAAGSWDCAAIGTDFDGFTDPPDDLKDASKLAELKPFLIGRGLPESAVDNILGNNARRVLRAAWQREVVMR